MTAPLIYAAYDYYDSETRPTWVAVLQESFPEAVIYDPGKPITEQHPSMNDKYIGSLSCAADAEVLSLLGFPPDLIVPIEEIYDTLLQAQQEAQQGYVASILAVNHYFLVRSSLVVVEGDTTFGSGPATDLILATQLRIPTILVCNRTVQPPWMLAYADVSVTTAKIVKLVATILKVQETSRAVALQESDTPPEPVPTP